MSHPTTLLADLLPIFYDTTAGAPISSMRRPYIDGDVVCATNAVVAVQAPASLFRPDVLAVLRPRAVGVPNVDRLVQSWRGDGRTRRLPAWDDGDDRDGFGPRSSVRVGWTPLLRRWVAFLLCHGVRVVDTGATADMPVRFDAGPVEGLCMPALLRPIERRHRYRKGV